MPSIYEKNKARSRIVTRGPTKTDQSQAKDTDINVIVGKFGITRRVPGTDTEPMAGDFSNLPDDLRGMIEASRDMRRRRAELPKELRDLPVEELLTLTPTDLLGRMTPPKKEEPNVKSATEGTQSGT